MGEKVGSDVLGQDSALGHGGLTAEQRMKLKKKLEEQKRQKGMDNLTDLEGKEIHEEGPSDQHEARKLGEHGYDEKDVAVRAHKRGRPNRKNWFERKAEEMSKE